MVIAVFVTIPYDKSEALARELLKEKVCVCINIVPAVESLYRWEGKIESSKEALIIIKTKDSLYGKLKVLIENNHPYSVPEIIAIDIDKINPKYLEWVNREVNAQPYSQ